MAETERVQPLSEVDLHVIGREHRPTARNDGRLYCQPCSGWGYGPVTPWPCVLARFIATIDDHAAATARESKRLRTLLYGVLLVDEDAIREAKREVAALAAETEATEG